MCDVVLVPVLVAWLLFQGREDKVHGDSMLEGYLDLNNHLRYFVLWRDRIAYYKSRKGRRIFAISILRNLKVAALGDYCMLFGPRVNSSHAFFSTVL